MRSRMAILALALVAVGGLALGRGDADTGGPGPRVAVVVGNADYQVGALPNPRNDARAVTNALRELGFQVVTIEDADQPELQELVQRLPTLVRPGDVALFYYAGHAVQFKGGNYLLPVDFGIDQAEQLPAHSLGLDKLLTAMGGAAVSVVVLDACRDYPFGPLSDVFGDGLAGVATSGETLVAYSTTAGATALDGDGPNSPYTSAFVAALEHPGQDLYDVFRTVRGKVREATRGRQIPWISGSIETRLVLRPEDQRVAADAAQAISAAKASADPAAKLAAIYWTSIARSSDPADFKTFLQVYPQGPLAELAALRQSELLTRGEQPGAEPEVADETVPGPAGRTVTVTACDRWAADPDDPAHVAPGVDRTLINTRQALRACSAAVAADPGNPRLIHQLGRALDAAERYEEAVQAYRRAADAGYAPAMALLGYLYRSGRAPEPAAATATGLYFSAAMLGHPGARVALGQMYKHGWGVPTSPVEAARWTRLAADTGYAPALDALAIMYRDGAGVPTDLGRAVELHRAAAAQGQSNAMNNLGQIYRDGRGVDRDLAEAVRWFGEATERGNPHAPYHLAKIYLDGGPGIAPDPRRAEALLKLAIERGHNYALIRLADLYAGKGPGGQDPERSAYYLYLGERVGEAVDHPVTRKMGVEARGRLTELAATLEPGTLDRARAEVDAWIEQNGLEGFQILYRY